jgi:hypothetical protein
MQKWEYKQLDAPADFMLNEVGADGWEIVAVNMDTDGAKYFTLKRPVSEDLPEVMSGSEAIYGFCAWLTGRSEVTEMGADKDCAIIAELAGRFCEHNGLPDPRDGWEKRLTMPAVTE